MKWPFTRERAAEALAGATKARVTFQRFSLTFLPHPGFEAEGVSFVRAGAPPLAEARALKVDGSWLAVLTMQRRVLRMVFDGLAIRIPESMPPPVEQNGGGKSETRIGELVADGAVLSVARDAKPPLQWGLRQARFTDVGRDTRIGFQTLLRIPEPPGEILAKGNFGPVKQGGISAAPVAGSFHLRQADLGKYENLAGILSAEGKFEGILAKIAVAGNVDVPQFEVNESGDPVHLKAAVKAEVDGTDGDVFLRDVQADFGRTQLAAAGTIEGNGRKTVKLRISSKRARVEDLVGLFAKGGRSAMRGPIGFRVSVTLPPGGEPFLRRLGLDGQFGIEDARFTKERTRRKVNELSARARTEASETEREALAAQGDVLSDLNGSVTLRNGVARLSDVSFAVPGAIARGGGTYNLIDKQVDMRGTVAMQAEVSEASTGIKSLLLKPFDAIFRGKKKSAGAVLPVSVTGTYPRVKFGLSLKQ